MPLAVSPSQPATAASTMARRSRAGVTGRSDDFCHGSLATTISTSSSPSRQRASKAAAKCPKWGGSKVPPRMPRRVAASSGTAGL